MAVITLALFSFGLVSSTKIIPGWVVIICAIAMAAGTLAGGMRLLKHLVVV